MDFKDSIRQISERIEKLKDNLQTEEATKNALVLPFLTALGYDVFNPMEVLPEMTCDIGTKKGEKIDYAILADGKPVILIECKHWQQNLNLHDNQLLRYFNVSPAKFGVLTNGIVYRFYTDLREPNKMDDKPFLEVDLTDLKDAQIEELKKFHKSYFDLEAILSTASELKYMGELKAVVSAELGSPSGDLVRLFAKQVYDRPLTPKVMEQFTALVRRAVSSYISDLISDRLKAATAIEDESVAQASAPAADSAEAPASERIVTTEEELQAYYIVKSILHGVVKPEDVLYRDSVTRFSVFLRGNKAVTLCQFRFSDSRKYIGFQKGGGDSDLFPIESLDGIWDYADRIIAAAKQIRGL